MTTNTFETKTYNGISIIINTNDGYVNASQMCSSNIGCYELIRIFYHFKRKIKNNQFVYLFMVIGSTLLYYPFATINPFLKNFFSFCLSNCT